MNIQTKPSTYIRSPRLTFRWTEEAIARAAEYWAEGLTSESIGLKLGCSRSSVTAMASFNRDRFPRRILGRTPSKSQSVDPAWYRRAALLWSQGHNTHRIAVITGVMSGTAHNRIKRRPDLFPEKRVIVLKTPPLASGGQPRSYIGNDRWVERVPFKTFAGAIVSLPRVSILNGKEG